MGEIADMMLDGTLDQFTGEYIGPAVGYPRSGSRVYYPGQKRVNKIRKELAILIKKKQAVAKTPGEKNHAVTLARQEINKKYGHDWRDVLKP